MSESSPANRFSMIVLVSGLLLISWAVFTGAGKKDALPLMFAEKLTYEQASERSRDENKPIFAVFSATWCGPCQSYKKGALSDTRVEKIVREGYIPAYIDVDEQRSAARKFQVSGIPVTMVIKGGEREHGAIGRLSADELLKFLDEAGKKLAPAAPKAPAQ